MVKKAEAGPAPCTQPLRVSRIMSPLLLGRCSRHLCKSSVDANMEYSRAGRVFILEH
jgi:hypothetical protein